MINTVKLTGTWKGGFRLDVQARDHLLVIDQPESSGGKNEGPNPFEIFLAALASCLGTVAAIIARQERIVMRAFEISIEGDFDNAFLMGKTEEGRAGFTEIRVSVNIDADLSNVEKKAFFNRVEARCPVTDNLVNNTKVVFAVD
jgi:uncharacterized OsmC-like protein